MDLPRYIEDTMNIFVLHENIHTPDRRTTPLFALCLSTPIPVVKFPTPTLYFDSLETALKAGTDSKPVELV